MDTAHDERKSEIFGSVGGAVKSRTSRPISIAFGPSDGAAGTWLREPLILLLVFVVASDVFGAGLLGACVLTLVVAMSSVHHRRVATSLAMLPLGGFALFHILLAQASPYVRFAVPLVALVMFMAATLDSKVRSSAVPAIIAGVAGTTVHAVANLATTYFTLGIQTSRLQIDAWTGLETSATVQAGLWIPLIGILPFLWGVGGRFRLVARVCTVLLGSLVVVFSLLSATRSPLLILLVTSAVCFFSFLTARAFVKTVVFLVPISAIALFLLVPRIKEFVVRFPLWERLATSESGGIIDDVRFERQASFLDLIFVTASGPADFRARYGYVHNMLLDEVAIAGLLPAFFLLIFWLSVLGVCLPNRASQPIHVSTRMLFVGLSVACSLHFLIEPVLESAPALFYVFCLIGGGAGALRRVSLFSRRTVVS